MIGGSMGVGKTTVCQQLKKELPNSVFLDGDWCWDADPFQITEETKTMVTENICFLLNQFLHCSAYENIIFCWVMHKQSVIDSLLQNLDTQNCGVFCVSLTADEKSLKERIGKDIQNGVRTGDVLNRSLARLPLYQALDTFKIDTNGKSVAMIADEIKALRRENNSHHTPQI